MFDATVYLATASVNYLYAHDCIPNSSSEGVGRHSRRFETKVERKRPQDAVCFATVEQRDATQLHLQPVNSNTAKICSSEQTVRVSSSRLQAGFFGSDQWFMTSLVS